MKQRKPFIVLVVLFVFLGLAIFSALAIFKGCNNDSNTVTITYSTTGTPVNSTKIKKGDTIGTLPFTDKQGYSFSGWFFDKELTEPVFSEDVINQNLTLYAGFEKQDINSVLPDFTEISIGTDNVYYEIQVTTDECIDERNLDSFVSVTALYGELPKISVLSHSNNTYSLSPIGGYQNGGVYKIALTDNRICFKGLNVENCEETLVDKEIKTVFLSVNSKNEETVSVKSGIFELDSSSVQFSDTENKFTSNSNVTLNTNSIVHIVDEENDRYIKITDIKQVNSAYEFYFEDCSSIDDVYSDFNINIGDISVPNDMTEPENQTATNNTLALVEKELYNSKGTEAITAMLANALNASPTIKSLTSNKNSYRDNISDVSGKTFTIKGLLEDLEIKISLGTAKNTNFNGIGISPFDDTLWSMLKIEFSYEADIKNNVKLEATVTVTQYLYVGLASSANKSTGDFKAEITPYSQTDIDFKILVCSMSKDDDKGEDKKEEKKDISVEIENLTNGNGDASNIIQDVQQMLENKGDAVELCKVPMFSASFTVAGIISVNIDLNFVIKVSFAAGVKIDATLLEATTIGVIGNYKTKTVDTYRRSAMGSDRYIFDFYAYGYLGLKAGIEGELSVSFIGLKQVLRAGVGIEVGAYADLYGYLHYHAEEKRVFKDVDTNGRHFQTLDGGVYFESGIYIELKAFIGVGKKEYGISKEFKFKLLQAGDKYLYVESCDNDDLTLIFKENDSNSIILDELIPVEGKFMDITTGEIETRVIPAKNIKLISNTNLFKVDSSKNRLTANLDKVNQRLAYEIPFGTISIYYKGPNILFSSAYLNENIPQLKGFKELCKVKVVYLPKDISLEEETDIGKELTITYKVKTPNSEETIKTETIVSGQYYKGGIPSEIIAYCRKNGFLTEIDGNAVTYSGFTSGKHILTENATFVFETVEAQRFIAIKYKSQKDFGLDTDSWTVDIMAMGYNELPTILPEQKYTPKNIYYQFFVVTPNGNKNVMGNEYLSKYDMYMTGVYGYETGKVLTSVNGTKQEIEQIFNQMKNNQGTLKDYSNFFTYTIEAEYITGMQTVYFYAPNGDYSQENVKYGETYKVPNYWVNNINQSDSKRLLGWDIDDDGEIDILPNQQFTVTADMILRPIMTSLGYTLTIIDFDGTTSHSKINAGDTIPQAIQDKINTKYETTPAQTEGSFYSKNYWLITTTDFVSGNDNNPYFKGISWQYQGDITIMPACDIVLKGVKGELYHYVTLTDSTGGHFAVQNEDGSVSNQKSVKIAVKDGSNVGVSKDYQNVKYVVPKEDLEKGFSNVSIVDENGEWLDIYGTIITSPKNYHIERFLILKDTYCILFEYYIYDEYGNETYYEKKHEANNVNKDTYEKLCTEYDSEYNYLRSNEFYAGLNSSEYTYSSYQHGVFDYISEHKPNPLGIVYRYYKVVVQKTPKKYKVTEIINDENYLEQESVSFYRYNNVYTCPGPEHYKFVEYNGSSHQHYFVGCDVDGDGIADYLPGEKILITKDITLNYLWKCPFDTPCDKNWLQKSGKLFARLFYFSFSKPAYWQDIPIVLKLTTQKGEYNEISNT